MSEPRSESENPVIAAPTLQAGSAAHEPGLVAEPARPVGARPARAAADAAGRRLRLRAGVRDRRRRRAEAGRVRRDDHVAGLVAGRLRPLRAAVHPDVVARRRHLPHRRRPGRWRERRAALRPAQQLARQRQPRQGAPVAVAGQAEVRPEGLVGRPDRLRRQLRAGVDGVHDVRVRLRAPGRVGARRGLLGPGGHVARRRALQRRAGPRRPVRRGADGPDLREPGGAQRQRRSGLRGAWTSARRSPAWRWTTRRRSRSSSVVTPSASATVRSTRTRSVRSPRRARSRRRASAGRSPPAPAWAPTRSPAGSKVRGPTSRRRGTTATSTTCSTTTTS